MCILAQMSVLSPAPNAYLPKALRVRNGSVQWTALLKGKTLQMRMSTKQDDFYFLTF